MGMNKNVAKSLLYYQPTRNAFKYLQYRNSHPQLSGNIHDTTKMLRLGGNNTIIDIPAPIYDFNLFFRDGVVIYTDEGSYAQLINVTGGFSGDHMNYIEATVDVLISNILNNAKYNGLKVKKVEIKR